MTNLQIAASALSAEDLIETVRKASRSDLRRFARSCDWSQGSEAVLGWMMAQKGMDLSTALTVFFNGDPARFNYLPKHDVPDDHHGASVLLDNICLRINSGFYRVVSSQRFNGQQRLDRWLNFQAADRVDGRRGRWILDEDIVRSVVKPARRAEQDEEAQMLERLQISARPVMQQTEKVTTRAIRRLSRLIPTRLLD